MMRDQGLSRNPKRSPKVRASRKLNRLLTAEERARVAWRLQDARHLAQLYEDSAPQVAAHYERQIDNLARELQADRESAQQTRRSS